MVRSNWPQVYQSIHLAYLRSYTLVEPKASILSFISVNSRDLICKSVSTKYSTCIHALNIYLIFLYCICFLALLGYHIRYIIRFIHLLDSVIKIALFIVECLLFIKQVHRVRGKELNTEVGGVNDSSYIIILTILAYY